MDCSGNQRINESLQKNLNVNCLELEPRHSRTIQYQQVKSKYQNQIQWVSNLSLSKKIHFSHKINLS